MQERIIKILMEELNYKKEAAIVTSRDLLEVQDEEIHEALLLWINTRKMTPVMEAGFDAVALTGIMTYPSALLAIHMLRKEPERAKRLLKGFR